MGKVFISKCVFANFILVYITYVTSFIIMCPVGTTLQRFEIIDAKLDSVTEYVINDVYPVERQRRDSMVMELNIKNDTREFVYSFHDDINDIRTRFVEIAHKRVIGYISHGSFDILLMSNIDDWCDVEKKLGTLIKPGEGTKRVDYLYYSVPQWGCGKYIMYEPLCWHFKYANGKVSHPIGRLGFY